MSYDNIEILKRKRINEFFKSNFNVNLDEYTENQRIEVLNQINKTLDNRIAEELNRYISLISQFEELSRFN